MDLSDSIANLIVVQFSVFCRSTSLRLELFDSPPMYLFYRSMNLVLMLTTARQRRQHPQTSKHKPIAKDVVSAGP
eukprot:671894-Amphidinium_carterae.1